MNMLTMFKDLNKKGVVAYSVAWGQNLATIKAYAVNPFPSLEFKFFADNEGVFQIFLKRYISENIDFLMDTSYMLMTCKDGEGRYVFNVARMMPKNVFSEDDAIEYAQQKQQPTIYDLQHSVVIFTIARKRKESYVETK